MKIRLPNNTQRTVEIGRTGTGKTVAGLYHLSNYDLSNPWVILNFKDDEHIESLPKTRYIDFNYVPGPRDEGLFIIQVLPSDTRANGKERPRLTQYFERIWQRCNCGIFIDEMFMVGKDEACDMCLTQGRSRRIPMIINTQKPSWISTFCFSEASFIQCFDLTDQNDINRIEGFMPLSWDDEPPLDEHQSYYYDVSRNRLIKLNPVPPMDEIRNRFDLKLRRPRLVI